jgi:hypothetical protein
MPVVTQVQVRRGTASQWTSANPTLASGEWGFETDTLRTKIGNGSTAWNSLAYATGSISISNVTGLGTGVETFLATPSSANLRTAVTDETGTGALVFGTSPTIATPTLDDPKINLAFDAQTGTTYTTVLNDNGQVVTMNNASANTLSIPTNASVAYPIGTQINVLQIGVGQTTIQAVTSGTTTIQSTAGTAAAPKIRARYGMATCIKANTDLWYVVGDLA